MAGSCSHFIPTHNFIKVSWKKKLPSIYSQWDRTIKCNWFSRMWLSKKWFSSALFNTSTLSLALCFHCIIWYARICYCLLSIYFHRSAHLWNKHEFNSMFPLAMVCFAFGFADINGIKTKKKIALKFSQLKSFVWNISQPHLRKNNESITWNNVI